MNVTKFVTKVVDGDTIHVDPFENGETSVRLLGIDTPETNYLGQSQGFHGEAAKEWLTKMLPVGTTVTIETDIEEKDKYGRILGYVFKDDENLNVRLVAEGLASPYQIFPNLTHFQSVYEAAKSSQAEKKGIYNPQNPLKELPFEFRMRIDRRPPHKFVGFFQTKFYYNPTEYKEVPVEERIFFFVERDALAAGYSLRPKLISLSHIVDKAYDGLMFHELLQAPVSALRGLSPQDAQRLHEAFGIKTIEDLATNKFFQWAQAIKLLAK